MVMPMPMPLIALCQRSFGNSAVWVRRFACRWCLGVSAPIVDKKGQNPD